MKYYDVNDSLNSCQRVLDEYLIKITAITSYGQSRAIPNRVPPPQVDDDFIRM